uniref:Uncharacterized protein n=1 Tax=viral metagenome TaxID=1070528 RepID=A0A6C0C5N8_9ZZZZ
MSCNKNQYDRPESPSMVEPMTKMRSNYTYESIGLPGDDQSQFADLQNAYSYTPTMAEFKNNLMQKSLFGAPSEKPLSETAEINANLNNLLSRTTSSKADQIDDIINSVYIPPQQKNNMLTKQNYYRNMPIIERKRTSSLECFVWIILFLVVLGVIYWMFSSYDSNTFDLPTDTGNFVVTLPE